MLDYSLFFRMIVVSKKTKWQQAQKNKSDFIYEDFSLGQYACFDFDGIQKGKLTSVFSSDWLNDVDRFC